MEDGTLPPFDVDKQAAYLRRLLRKGGTLLFARTSCLCTHSCVKCNEITPTDSLRLGRGETRGRESERRRQNKPTASKHVSGRLLTGRIRSWRLVLPRSEEHGATLFWFDNQYTGDEARAI
jgi:hypothetical protein